MTTTTVAPGTVPVLSWAQRNQRFVLRPDPSTPRPRPTDSPSAKHAHQMTELSRAMRRWDRWYDLGETATPNVAPQASWDGMARATLAVADRDGAAFTTWSSSAYWARGTSPTVYSSPAGQYTALGETTGSAAAWEASYARRAGRGVGVNLVALGLPGRDANVGPSYSNWNIGYRDPDDHGYQWFKEPGNTVAYLASRGVTLARVCINHERAVGSNGPGGALYETYMTQVDQQITQLTGAGIAVMLNPLNNYNFNHATSAAQTATEVFAGRDARYPAAAFADLWRRLALRYAGNPLVSYDLVNEPHFAGALGLTDAQAVAATNDLNQAALDAIRTTGSTQHVHVGLWPFSNFVDAIKVANNPGPPLDDPCGKYGHTYTFHAYTDADRSGQFTRTWAQEVADAEKSGNDWRGPRLYATA